MKYLSVIALVQIALLANLVSSQVCNTPTIATGNLLVDLNPQCLSRYTGSNLNSTVGVAFGVLPTGTTRTVGSCTRTLYLNNNNVLIYNNTVGSPFLVGPTQYTQLSVEMYLRLNSVAPTNGWVFSTDDGGFDRAIILHDYRYGSKIAAGIGFDYTSTLPTMPVGQWTHILATWQNGVASTIYVNGTSFSQIVTPNNNDGMGMSIGNLPTAPSDHYADVDVALFRVYNTRLTGAQADSLYAQAQQVLSCSVAAPCNYTGKNNLFVPASSTVADLNANGALDMRLVFTSDLGANSTTFTFIGASTRCNSNATAPTAGTWTVTQNSTNCMRTHGFQIDLGEALQFCNFGRIDALRNADTTTYRTDIMMTTRGLTKRIRNVDIYSTFETSVTIDIDFLNNITVASGNLSVYASGDAASTVFSRVITQIYDPLTGTVTLNILTSSNWPYQMTLNTFTPSDVSWPVSFAYANPRGPLNADSSNITGRCDDGTLGAVSGISGTDGSYNAGNPCAQYWTVVVRRSLTNCPSTVTTLARTNWTFNFTVGCHSLFTGACGFTAGDPASSLLITFNTNSDNVCPVLLDTESVTASIIASGSTYGSAAIADYVFGARTYLQVNVNSPIRLERTIIERITIVSGAPTANMVIYTNLLSAAGSVASHRTCQMGVSCTGGVFSSMSPASNLSPTLIDIQDSPSGNANRSHASWIWSSSTSSATGDSPTPVIVRVEVRVRFMNQSTVSDRRLILNTPVRLLDFGAGSVSSAETAFTINAASSVVDPPNNNNGGSSSADVASTSSSGVGSSLTVMGIVGAVVGVMGMVAAAALLIKSRREENMRTKFTSTLSA